MYINEEHKEIVEDRGYGYIGSYKCGEITIDNKNSKNTTYIRIKCSYCGAEYDVQLSHFKNGTNCKYCCNKYENSFAYYIKIELNEDLNKYWDWEKNKLNPYFIYKATHQKVWIKCTETNYHGSYEIACNTFVRNGRCPYCNNKKVHPKDSFAQWGIDNVDHNFINKYWSNKNTIDPFSISPRSMKKIWINCQNKSYHEDYQTTCDSFYSGNRCPYCNSFASHKVHPLDSFGTLYPEKAKYWSKKNKLSPYEISPHSNKKFWFVCEDCGQEFETIVNSITTNNRSMKCLNCIGSKGEQKINNYLKRNNVKFESQKNYKNLIGTRGGNLSYDFYLPDYNLLIEYQGEQHEKFTRGLHNVENDFKRQQEHDRRKKQYALDNNIDLLEIWYWDYNNINEILQKRLIN